MAFSDGFKKVADAPDSPQIDPAKARQMQAGAMQSGWQPKQWMANIKAGLGMTPPAAPANVGKMGG
jgi:hypothetical protein